MTLTHRVESSIRYPFLIASVIGLIASLAAHIESLLGIDPRHTFSNMWVFQLVLLLVLVPIMISILAKKSLANLLHPQQWLKWLIWALLAYYGVNFYWFLFWAAEHLDATMTWRVISSGWMLLFTVSAAFYEEQSFQHRNQ